MFKNITILGKTWLGITWELFKDELGAKALETSYALAEGLATVVRQDKLEIGTRKMRNLNWFLFIKY